MVRDRGSKGMDGCPLTEMVNDFMDHMAQGLEKAKAALTKDEYTMYYNC
jgi:hypothetical protein